MNNVFYIDRPVEDILGSLKKPLANGFRYSTVGDSVLMINTDGPEKKSLLFKPNSDECTFTYEVNGHFLGKYYYIDDKIIAKWPVGITRDERQSKNLIRELQEIFRNMY